MILGLNTNHDLNGKVYHVQTEDSGLDNPVIVTHCFISGTIIATRRADYSSALGRADLEDHIRNVALDQHREMVRALMAGDFDKASRLAGRGAGLGTGLGDIPLARGRPGLRPRPLLSPDTVPDTAPGASAPGRATPAPDGSDESIEQIDSAEMRLVDDGPIIEPDDDTPIEFPTRLLDSEPLDPVLLAWLLEDDQVN
jgi:hypothetical protein